MCCQNYWVFGPFHRPVFYKIENTTFRELNLCPSSSGLGEKPRIQLGSLDEADLSHLM
jgi:hypothetical protein